MDNIEEARIQQLIDCDLAIVANEYGDVAFINKWARILYIGANMNRFHFRSLLFTNFVEFGDTTAVCEISKERCDDLQENIYWLKKQVVCNDILTALRDGWFPFVGLVIWSHGPATHPYYHEVLLLLEKVAKKIIIMTPWGHWEQTAGLQDIDVNKTAIEPEYFLRGGYTVNCIGEKDTKTGNLLAWKTVKPYESSTPEAGVGEDADDDTTGEND